VGGSWLLPANVLESGDWGRVTRLAAETRHLHK
jgi:2-keto-3-deoxy-6-phosphogluconate aldolase